MFNFKEIKVIYDALRPISQSSVDALRVIQKMHGMVSSTTWESIAPCVRPYSPNKPDDTDFRERIVVFESERELLRLLEEVAWKKEKDDAGHQFVIVCVPNPGLADRIGKEIWRYLGRQFEPARYQLERRNIELRNGLHIHVVTAHGHDMCGLSVEWAFLYNEVSGF